jgi:type IV pilus assembly protein PilM
MALTLKKNLNRGTVGLDLDAGFLAAVQADENGVAQAASVDLPTGVINDGEVADVDALTDALKKLFKAHELPRRVRLGVANQQIVVRHLELPRIEDPKERDAAVRFQAAEAIAMPLEEVVLDYQVIGETVTPEGAAKHRMIVVAAREAMISRIIDAVRGAGLKAEGVDLNAFALVRALANDGEAPDDSARVFCHLGGITNLAIAVGSTCLFTRPLSTNLEDEDENLAASLAEEIRLSIDFYMTQPEARWVGEVLLSGPGSRRAGLAEQLSSLIGVPVSTAQPLGRLSAEGIPADEDPYRHTVAAGLALGAES